jgi:hypothetical protein
VYVASGLVDVLVPWDVLTATVPEGVAPFGKLGAVTLSTVSETTLTPVAWIPSTVTEGDPALNPDPTTVRGVPPATGPVRGQTPLTVG